MNRQFYEKPADQLAPALLGALLVSRSQGQLTSGWIVETEAYLPMGDSACHAVRGETRSNQSMFGVAGLGYVYPIHAKHCFNVVAGVHGEGTAVLIRALQPCDGIKLMMRRRQTARPLNLCRGPARLCQALGIDRSHDGHDLTSGEPMWIQRPARGTFAYDQIRTTERIGVTSAEELQLRFVVADCRYVSGPARMR
ncbi:MAG: DNA-3-methyladenine glycosylase [Pirellulaceae bacterium]